MGIKTREPGKSRIKTIEQVARVPGKAKTVSARTRDGRMRGSDAEDGTATGYASEQVSGTSRDIVERGGRRLYRREKRAVQGTKENLSKARDRMADFKKKKEREKAAGERREPQNLQGPSGSSPPWDRTTVEGEKSHNAIRQRAEKKIIKTRTGKTEKTVQGTAKNTIQAVPRGIKTAQAAARATVRTSGQAAGGTWATVGASVQAAKKRAWMVSVRKKGTWRAIRGATKAAVRKARVALAGAKALTTALIAGGSVALSGILMVSFVGMLASSVFGIFFSGEDSGSGMTMREAVWEINGEYETRLNEVIDGTAYDVLEVSGGRAAWKEVLAVYAVKTATDPEAPQEVATMDAGKKELLKGIFWEMHEINSRTESRTETEVTESEDDNGDIVQEENTASKTILYVTVSRKTAWEMADQYGFSEEQREQLSELLSEEHAAVWSQVLYGIGGSDSQIVSVALEQVGNGGDTYWSWYGFDYRVEWCACFVSWCANECGYLENGIIPKFASCQAGSEWFKDRGQWQDRNFEPSAGQLIFFDWEGDGHTEHVGIVERVENGTVYTVEGNSGDLCRQRGYPIGSGDIYGYGIPGYE